MDQSNLNLCSFQSCLDRTNVAQFSAGVEAIAQQLIVMGIRSQRKLGPFSSISSIVRVLTDSYVDIGDCIALQYGGSEAHKKVTAGVPESTATGPIGKVCLAQAPRWHALSCIDVFPLTCLQNISTKNF